ncbi:MAG TPA: PAS domain S-box protein [Burkholderiaceae bacterium]|jgi:PAS domain S-box-containing protein|nr:PAS domain S-box protein [Burkholderiaceae bacterium]
MTTRTNDSSAPEAASCPAADSLYAQIVQQAGEAIIFADPEGFIRVWNEGAQNLFGFPASQALGASLDLIIPERFRAAHWRGFHQAIERGRPLHGGQVRTTRAVHGDGRKLYVEMSFGIVTGPDGKVLGSLAVARDGTERRSAEEARSSPT